jgi:transcription termination factor Rho
MAAELNDLHLAELHERAAEAGIPGYRRLRREELIDALSEQGPAAAEEEPAAAEPEPAAAEPEPAAEEPEPAPEEAETDELEVVGTVLEEAGEEPETAVGAEEAETEEVRGVLELTRQRYGFLRLAGLAPAEGDVYISAAQVRRCELRPGDEVSGPAREPRRGERHRALVHVDQVNGEDPQEAGRPEFDSLAPVLPERRIGLDAVADDVLVRAADLLAPLAFGQRGLVRAAPRSGRTTLLRSIARAAATDDSARVVVLLVDEAPEDATAWREALPVAEFAIATADQAPTEQVRIAELALERSRRLAEAGVDAVLICDSLSRLATAAGDAAEVKRLFGSGRNLAGGGSLTVVATVLADSSDEGEAERAVITTESSLVVLDPALASRGVTPALRPAESAISNEEGIREPAELEPARRLRATLAELEPAEAAVLLRDRIEATRSNAELLASL